MTTKHRRRIKIYLLDPHPIVRQGVVRLIENEPGLTICGEGGHPIRALRDISSLKPDFLIMGLSLKGMHGLQLIKKIKTRCPALKILVLTACDGSVYAARCLRAGAKGFVPKTEDLLRLRTAMHQVLKGHIVGVQTKRGSNKARVPLALHFLSDRELEVFRLIGKGYRSVQIGKTLGLSHKTIEFYREKIKFKLNLDHGYELLQQAIQFAHLEASCAK